MKELSVEEKAKAYDEAFERYKAKRDFYGKEIHDFVEYLFPELNESAEESEDERIKAEIVEHINNMKALIVNSFREQQFNSWLAWLEKQGEQKPVDKCEGCNNIKGCITCVDGYQWAHIEEQKSVDKKGMNLVEEEVFA